MAAGHGPRKAKAGMSAWKRIGWGIMGLVLLVSFWWGWGFSSGPADDFSGVVIWVADGDTFKVRSERSQYKIRVYGIDAPEQGQPFHREALELCLKLTHGQRVRLRVVDRDRYGRLVAAVTLPDGADLAEVLLQAGLAWQYRRYNQDPKYRELENQAREAGRGIWSAPNPTPPWDYKKRKSPAGRFSSRWGNPMDSKAIFA
jgi:endonuclease YncB( thermonuclease family)